jgi:hypothetical protein
VVLAYYPLFLFLGYLDKNYGYTLREPSQYLRYVAILVCAMAFLVVAGGATAGHFLAHSDVPEINNLVGQTMNLIWTAYKFFTC